MPERGFRTFWTLRWWGFALARWRGCEVSCGREGGSSYFTCLNSFVNSTLIMLKLRKLGLVTAKRFYLYQCNYVYSEQWTVEMRAYLSFQIKLSTHKFWKLPAAMVIPVTMVNELNELFSIIFNISIKYFLYIIAYKHNIISVFFCTIIATHHT